MKFIPLSLNHNRERGTFSIEGTPAEAQAIEDAATAMESLEGVDIVEASKDEYEAFCVLTFDKYIWAMKDIKEKYATIKTNKVLDNNLPSKLLFDCSIN